MLQHLRPPRPHFPLTAQQRNELQHLVRKLRHYREHTALVAVFKQHDFSNSAAMELADIHLRLETQHERTVGH